MKTQTNMNGVRATAKALLLLDLTETEFSPMVVQHPFTNTGVSAVQEQDGLRMLDLVNRPEDLQRWRMELSGRIDQAEKPYDIYMMLNKAYALTFLKYAEPYLSKEDHSDILSSAWLMAEAPNSDANVSRRKLVSMFRRADPAVLMDDTEREQLAALPDTVTVYRGVTDYNGRDIQALSWTLDKETANWFAHRFGENGSVYEAQIDKENILALFSGRKETEVVLDPKYLREVEQVQDMVMEEM